MYNTYFTSHWNIENLCVKKYSLLILIMLQTWTNNKENIKLNIVKYIHVLYVVSDGENC